MPGKTHDRTRGSPQSTSTDGTTAAVRPSAAAYTVLVRLWKEPRTVQQGEAIWRGTLSDLQGRPLGSFTTATDLAEMVQEIAGTSVLLRFACDDGNAPVNTP
jgi:hypothetical protein